MLIYSILIFLMEFVSCVQQVFFLLKNYLKLSEIFFQYLVYIDLPGIVKFTVLYQFIIVDIITLAPAWFILATNKQLRQAIVNMCFGTTAINPININLSHTLRSSSV